MKFRRMGPNRTLPPLFTRRRAAERGSILVYIVVTMVIFGLLGALMVSLFSTSISSSATANESRRAFYLAESGLRYGMSELRNRGFSDSVIDPLNQTLFNLPPHGAFDLNVLSYWFAFASGQDIPGSGSGTLTVDIPKGEIPQGIWSSAPANLFLVQCNNTGLNPQDSARSIVTSFTIDPLNRTSLDINLTDDGTDGFAKPDKKAQLCFAVKPESDQLISPFSNLRVDAAAKDIFPKNDGAIMINRRPLFYKSAVDRGSYFELTNITFASWDRLASAPEPVNLASDYIILTPRNYVVLSKGQSGDVTFGGDMAHSVAVTRRTAGGEPPDIGPDNLDYSETGSFKQNETTTDFIKLNETDKSITIGGGSGNRFGSVLFRDNRNIGGTRNFCSNGSCLFGQGIRLFFTLEYTGSGDGFVFALINGNPNKNDAASVGGDIERSEMLGYAGDSRLSVDGTSPPDPPFLDNSGPKRGLIPPKIGLEFDTKVNISAAGSYCADATSLNANTRNDPGTPAAENRDAVQFVYWGASTLNVPCRANDPSYDDNRHNTLFPNWNFDTGGVILSSPALATDGTIYVGSNSTIFFAVNPDGTEKWRVNSSGPWYSPTVTSSGRIYVGTGAPENNLFALNPGDHSNVSGFPFPTGGPVTTKPAAGTTGDSTGIVYFGSDDGKLYAVTSSGTPAWPSPRDTGFDTGAPVKSSPALSANGNTVYFGSNNGNFYARHAGTGAIRWTATVGGAYLSSPVVGPDGTIYVGNDDGSLYAFDGSTGGLRPGFPFPTGASVMSSPALSNDGSVVYIGSSNGILFAVNTSGGIERWRFAGATDAIESAITIDANGNIYFGSNDNNVYSLYPDGTQKWSFSTGGNVETKPAVKTDGTVYAGSRDRHLYSINQSTAAPNLKDLLITSSGSSPVRVGGVPVTMTSEEAKNWLKKGPWAVRLEVTRALVSGATYELNLRAWVRQCGLNCSDVLGTFYEDTRVNYSPTSPTPHPPQIEQTIRFDEEDANNPDFNRFIFGFTSQTAAGESQTATIQKFQLSFIRPNDPTVTDDPGWP